MKRPIIILLISYIFGFLCFEYLLLDLYFWLLFIILFAFLILKYKSKAYIFVIVFALAYSSCMSISKPMKLADLSKKHEIEATIVDKKTNQFGHNYILYIKLPFYGFFKASYSSKIEYDIANVLKGRVSFNLIDGRNNFRSFSYRRYMMSKKVFLSVGQGDLSYTGHDNSIYIPRRFVKDFIRANLDSIKNIEDRAFAESVVLGEKNMDKEVIDRYNDLGLSHLLAVSGLHISIIIGFLEGLSQYLGIRRRTFSVFVTLLLLFYGYVIDFPISLIRAFLMYSIKTIAIHSKNIQDGQNSIYLSLFISLLINPYYLYSPALYFSYGAIFSVTYIKNLLEKNIKLNNPISKVIFSSAAIQIGILPIQLYFYSKLNLLSIFINIMIIPIASIPVLISFLSAFGLNNFIGIMNVILDGATSFINLFLNFFSKYNKFNIDFSFGIFELFIYYLTILTLLNLYRYRLCIRKKLLMANALILVFSILFSSLVSSVFSYSITFIDVGQGDAILLEAHGKYYLVDSGGNPKNPERSYKDLYEFLNKNGVTILAGVFLSHRDFDHVGNLEKLKNDIPIESYYVNPSYGEEGDKFHILNKGDKINLGEMRVEVVSADSGSEGNDASMVLELEIFGYKILLTGDIEKEEMSIANGKIDILKVSHHGSKSSTSVDFLEITQPKEAIISAGLNNSYGHPSPIILKRLDAIGAKIYRTSHEGSIKISFLEDGYFLDYYYKKHSLKELVMRGLQLCHIDL